MRLRPTYLFFFALLKGIEHAQVSFDFSFGQDLFCRGYDYFWEMVNVIFIFENTGDTRSCREFSGKFWNMK